MSEIPIEMNKVSKKFKKGELYSSLRDFIPALTKTMFTDNNNKLQKQEFWALRDISLKVEKGKALGIIGPNGAGKSTILKLLSGIMKPTCGTLKLTGKVSALIEISAGFHQDLTGRENIFLNGAILGMKREEIKKKLDRIVDFADLESFIDTPVKRYSSGMYARLGFAVLAHLDPDVLLVDEVLSVGDAIFQKRCLEKMRSVMKSGSTVVFISHNLKMVSELCNEAIFLDGGQIIKSGPTGEIVRYYMDSMSSRNEKACNNKAYISKFSIRDENGGSFQFESGQDAWVDIEITANSPCENLGLALEVQDENFYTVFDTSTYRLGMKTFSMETGDKFKCTFKLNLFFAQGIFHFRATLFRYDLYKAVDTLFPAATISMISEKDVLGSVNLFPDIPVYEHIK